jgi:hypothetical protein
MKTGKHIKQTSSDLQPLAHYNAHLPLLFVELSTVQHLKSQYDQKMSSDCNNLHIKHLDIPTTS